MPSSKADTSERSESRNASSKSKPNETAGADTSAAAEQIVTLDRRRPVSDRRGGDPDALDVGVRKNPRRKTQRRRHIDPTTCERDYSDPEIEFMRAMDDYKRKSGRMFPTCSEVLEVVRDLGYFRLTDQQIDLLGLGEGDDEAVDAVEADALEEEEADV